MKKQALLKLVTLLALFAMAITLFTACQEDEPDAGTDEGTQTEDTAKEDDKDDEPAEESQAAITGADDVTVDELTMFDPLAGVSATAADGSDATGSIEVSGMVNTLKAGDYELTYTTADLSVTRVVTVSPVDAVLANGVYNYKFAQADLRHTFMAAAEDYLLHTQYAGVPLFANASFNLYSSRMQLMSEEYIAVLGFGTGFSTMAADDSAVLMEDGENGNAGEFTMRTSLSGNPSQWNHWLYDDSVTADVMGEFLDALYVYEFNDDKSGYVLAPSMAAGNPTPIDASTLPSGKVVSKKWQVSIKDGLEWKFNDTTDVSAITDFVIDGNDFYDTYKIALEQQWFRAVSGGGDFCTSNMEVINAQAFVDGTAEWEAVGIKLIDDSTIEFEFVDDQSEWNVKYFLGSFVMSPIHTEQFAALGENFALDENSIAYHGVYYVDYFESDKVIRYTKNEKYHDADKYFYTNRLMTIIEDSEMRFQEFLAGKLDAVGLPSTHYEEYSSHPGLKRVPGTTTFRMMLNGTGTVEGQVAKFPESEWVPEPIVANQDFKMGIFHAIDRQKLAEEVLKTSQTQMYLFTDAYLVEAETGIPYRATEQGETVGADLSPSTHGYNLDAARAYFDLALDTLTADGVYASGDVITIEFYYFSGSDAQELMAQYLKQAMEEAFVSEKHNISVTVEIVAKDFPGIYYDHMMVGEFDTSIGGISGSTLDAASFLDTYSSDNRSGFTLNWGIDTSVAEIEVAYMNNDGVYVKELWAFDAIVSALNGEIEVVDGEEKVMEEEAPAE